VDSSNYKTKQEHMIYNQGFLYLEFDHHGLGLVPHRCL